MRDHTTTCYSCGKPMTGKYCSNCGHEREEDNKNALLYFLNLFSGISEIRKNARIFFQIFKSPTKKTIHFYEALSQDEAIKFFIFSMAVFGITEFASLIFISKSELGRSLFETFYYIISYIFCIPIAYFCLTYKNKYTVSLKSFIKIACLMGGFVIIIAAVFLFLMSINLWLAILSIVYFIFLFIYIFRIWKWIGHLSTKATILRMLVISPILLNICMKILLLLIFHPIANIFGIKSILFNDPEAKQQYLHNFLQQK